MNQNYTVQTIKQLGRRVNDTLLEHIQRQLEFTVQLKCHSDFVSKLPPEATHFASSKRVEFEMFGIGEQVLCMQCHPDFNQAHIQHNLIDKLYDSGMLEDTQKKEAESLTHNTQLQLQRHTMNKIVFNFLNL